MGNDFMEKLSFDEVSVKMANAPGWEFSNDSLIKKFRFDSFKEAINFVNSVALISEEMDHHPNIIVNYNIVTLNISTHSAGGVTNKDFVLVEKIESL